MYRGTSGRNGSGVENARMLGRRRCFVLRCLVVDDDKDGALALGAYLRVLGADVRVVFHGRDAIPLALQFQPRLVVLDINMPGFDGFETAKLMKEQAWSNAATFVAHSGETIALRPAVMAAGFHHFLTKGDSSSIKAFQSIVARLLGQPGYRRDLTTLKSACLAIPDSTATVTQRRAQSIRWERCPHSRSMAVAR